MRSNIFTSLGVALLAGVTSACAPSSDRTGEASEATTVTGPIEAFTVVLEGPAAVSVIPRGVSPRSPEAALVTRARVREIEAEHAAIEPVLVAHGAQIIARLSRLANAVEILADEATARRIEGLPGVREVERNPIATRMLGSAVPLIGAPNAWAGVPMLQGDGVTIGVIDSGIDYTHADFGGVGTTAAYATNDSKIIEPGSFPTARVVGGWDFVGDAYNPETGNAVPKPDPDPLDCAMLGTGEISGGHGTHVAGIAAGGGVLQDGSSFAGPYEASFDPSVFRVAPGVAPRAKLYPLRVFGCQGGTNLLNAALDRASDPNDDGAFDDRLDVVNLSLGIAYGLGSNAQANMVAQLAKIGTLVVAAAGNEGQNYFVTGAPGVYPEVLSVAASVDNDLLTLVVTSPLSAAAEYAVAEAVFTKKLSSVGPISGEIVAASPILGCSALTNAAAVAGKIAILDRGSCPFVDKINNAAAAGAIAAVIVDNEDMQIPFAMGGANPDSVGIPGFMVRMADGVTIEGAIAQSKVTVAIDPGIRFTGPGAELLAGLSSRGPSPVDGRLKPEISAPGVDIVSAGVASGTEPAALSGTSMASPMVAGAAALVRQAQPGWSPSEVKAALINTAGSLRNFTGVTYGTGAIGGGRVNAAAATTTTITAAADPATGEVAVSFGSIVAAEPTTVKRGFVVANHGGSTVTLDATVVPTFARTGLVVSVSPSTVSVAAGQSATLELTLSLDPEAFGNPGVDPGVAAIQGMMNPSPRHFLNEATGVVQLATAGGANIVTLPYNGSVRAAVRRKGVSAASCGLPDDPVEIALEGGGAHPAAVVTAFQLGALDEAKANVDTNPALAMIDLRAVGVATDLATATSFNEAQVFFGMAVSGPWTTAARGSLSVVSIEIDTDQKGAAEYAIRVEARNADPPFRDGLVASTYDRATGERINRYPINILPPDEASTYPFHNSVLVVSAKLSEIGIDPSNPVFGWSAVTERPDLLLEGERVKGTFDASKLLVDTTRYGMGGAPIFVGGGPLKVHLTDEARAAGNPVDVLLLHHTNVPGERWEVVSVPVPKPANLKLETEAPASVWEQAKTSVSFVVTNEGVEPATGVKLDGGVNGGVLIDTRISQGSCSPGALFSCTIGEIAAGASVTLTARVRAPDGGTSIALDARVKSDLACEAHTDDNEAVARIGVLAPPTPPPPVTTDLYVGGGCSCDVGAAGERGDWHAGWLVALGLLAARRRRGARR